MENRVMENRVKRGITVIPFAVFFDTGSTECHDMTFNIGQHAIGVTAATTRSFTIKVSSYNGTKLRGWGVQGDWIITQVNLLYMVIYTLKNLGKSTFMYW